MLRGYRASLESLRHLVGERVACELTVKDIETVLRQLATAEG